MTRSIARYAVAGAAAVSLAVTAGPALAGTHPSGTTRPAATHLTLKATKETPKGAHSVKATVVGTLRARHAGVAGEPVELYERKGSGKAWTDTGSSQTTDENGKATFTFTQSTVNEQYQLRFAGDPAATPPLKKSHSGVIAIHRARSTS